ncbi:MAG: GNAT family N-acetyltransferase, partial [Clostridia bacterium]|nr:GNAT family N-acetyltransferase [Clostridia bacterium]
MVKVRVLEEKFLKQIPNLIKQYKDGYNGEWGNLETDVDGMIKKYQELKNNKNYLFVQAIEHENLIGFAEVCINEDIVEDQRPIAIIWDLRVDKTYRSKGIGTNTFW